MTRLTSWSSATRLLSALAMLVAVAPASAQTEVPAGSDGHSLEIRLANPSDVAEIATPGLRVGDAPPWVTSARIKGAADVLEPGEARRYLVSFGIAANAPPGARGDLVLEVTAEAGVYPDESEIRIPLLVAAREAEYVYLLSGIQVPSGVEHRPGELGYSRWSVTEEGTRVTLDAVACTQCPERVALGEPFELAAAAWLRYDWSTYRCEAGLPGRAPEVRLGGDLAPNVSASGRSLLGPGCGESSGSKLFRESEAEIKASASFLRIDETGAALGAEGDPFFVYDVEAHTPRSLVGEPFTEISVRVDLASATGQAPPQRLRLLVGEMTVWYQLDRAGARPIATRPFVLPDRGPQPAPPPPVERWTGIDLDQLIGLPLREAMTRLADADLVGKPVLGRRAPSSGRAGRVEAASAEARPLERGGTVVLRVYRDAVESTVVPELVGTPLEQARARLQQRGLRLVPQVEGPTDRRDQVNRIARQSPPAGTEVKAGSTVTVGVWAASASAAHSGGSISSKQGSNPAVVQGLPFFEVPPRIGAYTLEQVRICEGDRLSRELGPVRRIERPASGFACRGSHRTIQMEYRYQGGFGALVHVRWQEEGDREDWSANCKHDVVGRWNRDNLRTYMADSTDSRVVVQVGAGLYVLEYKIPRSEKATQERALVQFVEEIRSQVAEFAAPCR